MRNGSLVRKSDYYRLAMGLDRRECLIRKILRY